MTRRLVFRPEVEAELAEAVDWYEAHGRGLGAEFLRNTREDFQFHQQGGPCEHELPV